MIVFVFFLSFLAILYYMMAAEAGIEEGTFNLAWLCEENKVNTAFLSLKFHFMSVPLLDVFVVVFVFN